VDFLVVLWDFCVDFFVLIVPSCAVCSSDEMVCITND